MQFSIFITPFFDWTSSLFLCQRIQFRIEMLTQHLQWTIYWEDEKIWRMNEMWRRFNTNFYYILTAESYYSYTSLKHIQNIVCTEQRAQNTESNCVWREWWRHFGFAIRGRFECFSIDGVPFIFNRSIIRSIISIIIYEQRSSHLLLADMFANIFENPQISTRIKSLVHGLGNPSPSTHESLIFHSHSKIANQLINKMCSFHSGYTLVLWVSRNAIY